MDELRKMKLGDIGPVKYCKEIKIDKTLTEGIPFYKIGTMGGVADSFITQEQYNELPNKPTTGSVLVSAMGTIGKLYIYDGELAYFCENIFWIENDESIVLNKYLYYFYEKFPWKINWEMPIPGLQKSNIERTEIIVPPIEYQLFAIEMLDRMKQEIKDLEYELEEVRRVRDFNRNELFEMLKPIQEI